jgi:adenylylsulfate kinase
MVQKSQKAYVVWFTGLSGSGKSTLANALDCSLYDQGLHTYVLDGDNLRHGLNRDLAFSEADRQENIRRVGEVAKLFTDSGLIVLAAFISPFDSDRSLIKTLIGEENIIEVYLDTPLNICEKRDPKGLYKMARNGQIKSFTGIDSPYEVPKSADIVLNTEVLSEQECVDIILNYVMSKTS